jgi:hypothetical protein
VHEPWDEPLQQLPLAEDDDGLVPNALRQVVVAREGRTEADEAREEQGAARRERDRDGRDRRQGERGQDDGYPALAFLSSAEIAGTISCRSPITP